MTRGKRNQLILFLACALSIISALFLLFSSILKITNNNYNKVYASNYIVSDNFDFESKPYAITSDYDTGWKTFDERNARLFFSDGTEVSENDLLFELNSSRRNSYYRNVLLTENEDYNFNLIHRGRFGADTLALIIGDVQKDDSDQVVNPTVNSSTYLDQFMQMTDWIVANNYIIAKVGVDPSIIVYSKKFSAEGGFVGDSAENFSLEPTDECTEKWNIIFITSEYYEWTEHKYTYTAESTSDYLVSLTHVKSRGKNVKGVDAGVGEGNLIRSFSIKDSTSSVIYSCDESNLTESTKSTVNGATGYTNINSANNPTPYSADIWNVTETTQKIEIGRSSFDAYKILNLTQTTPVEGNAFLLSQGVYKDYNITDLTLDYINFTFSNNSRYQQSFRLLSLPIDVQITTDNITKISQIDYIEQYLNTVINLQTYSKATIYTSTFGENGLFTLPLEEAFSLKKDSNHSIKVEIYNFYSSTTWKENSIVFDNSDGTYNNGIKICFGGYGTDKYSSIFIDSITFTASTFDTTFEGNGTHSSPYQIQTTQDFLLFRKSILSGISFKDIYFEQTANLNFDTIKLDCIIGDSPNFIGIYNGKGYKLSNITMDYSNYSSSTNTRSSIFYNVLGSVTNLGLEDSNFTAVSASTFADNINGYGGISNCYAQNVSVIGATTSSYCAGIALIITGDATIENIYFNGTISGTSDANNYGIASYRSKTCKLANILTTTTTLLKNIGVAARDLSANNCAIKTEEELQAEDVLTLLNSYASEKGFHSWQSDITTSLPVLTQISGISLKSFSVTDSHINETVKSYYSIEDNKHYLLLPNYFNLSELRLSYIIITDDIKNASIKIYDLEKSSKIYDLDQVSTFNFSTLTEFIVEVRVSDSLFKDYIFSLMQGENASIFISLDNGDIDFSAINMDTNHNIGATGLAKIIDYDGHMESHEIKEMRGRGNFSWGLSKKPYQLKFKDSFSMLGMKKSKTWLLIANHTDGSLARSATFYELSKWFGIDYSVEFEVINVYINGNYNGLYLVTSKVQVDKNRINIADDDYLIEIDNTVDDYQFQTDKNASVRFTIKNPDLDKLSTEERNLKIAEIKSYIEFIESKIYDQSVTYAELSTYLDMESFAKYYWIQELSLNYDAMYGSSYMYTTTDIESGSKTLHMGPIWDMDNTIGFYTKIYADYSNLKYYNLLNDSFGAIGKRVKWYNQLMQRQEFSDLIDEVFIRNYKQYLSYSENNDSSYSGIVGFVSKYLEDTHKSALMNYARWSYNTMTKEQSYWMGGRDSYDQACTNLINYLKARIDFYYGEYKQVLYKSIIVEYLDKDGFKNSFTRNINNIDKIFLPINVDKDNPITLYGITYDNTYFKISDISLNNEKYSGTLYSAQTPSITVADKIRNRSSISVVMSIEQPTVTEIVIETMPSKLNYFIGELFDSTDMVVRANFSDGTSEIISNYEISYSPFTEGENVVTISYAKRSVTLNITANYVVITWTDDNGKVMDTQNLEYGQMPTYSGPELSKDYLTMRWDPVVTEAIENKTYKAVFEMKTFSVKFYNDTQLLKELEVNYGDDAIYDLQNPIKEGTAQYSYEFEKWVTENGGVKEVDLHNVTSDLNAYASYIQTINTYTITFTNYNGEILQQSKIAFGDTPEYLGATPTKTATAEYSYQFRNWSPSITTVSENATYIAEFTQTKNSYTITWKNGNIILDTDTLLYGALPVYSGDEPTKASTDEYSYTFIGWTPTITNVTENAIYSAKFKEQKKTYIVTFKDYDDRIIQCEVLEYGSPINLPTKTPTRPATKEFSYTFDKWLNYSENMVVTQNLDFVASYNEQAIKNTTLTDETFNVQIELEENLANETKLKVLKQENTTSSHTILNNKYENVSNLVVYRISLVDNNENEIENINSYAKIKIQIPNNIDKKNLVIYNLTSQKTVSYEISEDYAVCELNALGEIALFNNQNKALPNDNNENNSNTKELKIVIFTLACLNIILFVVCIIFIYKIKTKKNNN